MKQSFYENALLGALAAAIVAMPSLLIAPKAAAALPYKLNATVWQLNIDAMEAEQGLDASDRQNANGFVFEDLNQDGRFQPNLEPGIPGVMVSNGLDVAVTDERGRYRLRNIQDELSPGAMTIFITKPAGYDVPVDEYNVPQFFYHHIPGGSPLNMRGDAFRFGGLPATGKLPLLVNFPLVKGEDKKQFVAAFSGDTQTYDNIQVGYLRDTLAKELAQNPDVEFIMVEGDVLGDDLSLFPRYKSVMTAANMPVYLVPGNHDLDFDASDDANSFDTFKREWGPAYYSFDIGDVHFIVMDSMEYPCKADANADGLHPGCDDDILSGATYNGVIDDTQLQWLYNDLASVPKTKLVVVNMHIPAVSFFSQFSTQGGMMDNMVEFYEALGCKRAADGSFPPEDCERKVLMLYGHIHTVSNVVPGESYEGWATALDSGSLPPGRAVPNAPFPMIDTGAACGSWWDGDFDETGVPESWDRMGSPKGYYLIEFDGSDYVDTYKGTNIDISRQMSLSILSPEFEEWYNSLIGWWETDPGNDELPPVSRNDLPDTSIVLAENLKAGTVYLQANVWNGNLDSKVSLSIDGGDPLEMVRTQPGEGEGLLESLDPYQLEQTLQIARYAFQSTSGNPDAQGYRRFRGSVFGPASPRPSGTFGTATNHLWRVKMPADLEVGTHTAVVTTIDDDDRKFTEALVFEVAEERPNPYWQDEFFPVTP